MRPEDSSRVGTARSRWSVVYGPAAALVATLWRLGWQVSSATQVVDDFGCVIDFVKQSPTWVTGKVRESVLRWRWRRVESLHTALDSGGAGRGPAWRPIVAALKQKDSPQWGPEHKGALRSPVMGRQWLQQRLHGAGLVDDNLCKLCRDLPSGGLPGTLLHRHVCPALCKFREQHMPKWLDGYLVMNGRNLDKTVRPALARGLFPAPFIPNRGEELFDTFVWVKQSVDVPIGCIVFTDGSLIDSKLPSGCQSLGWSFLVINGSGDLIASANGVPPKWVDTIQGAELWAVRMALLSVAFPEALYTDCDSVRSGVRKGPAWAGSAKRRYARIWLSISGLLEEAAELVHWMPAHTPESSIGHVFCSDGTLVDSDKWCSNQIVDQLAKDAADTVRLPAQFRSRVLHLEAQLKELAIYLGKLTHEVNAHQTDVGVLRDPDPLKPRRRAKPTGKAKSRTTGGGSSSGGSVTVQSYSWRMPKATASASEMHDSFLHKVSRKTSVKRAQDGLADRQEAEFMEWWREARSSSMQPRSDNLPSAKSRLEALRVRVVARGSATGSC